MDYVLALFTMFLVFVVPVIILVAIIGAPIDRVRARRRGANEGPPAPTMPGGQTH